MVWFLIEYHEIRIRIVLIQFNDIVRVIVCHGRWVVLAFPSNPSGHFQKTMILRMCSLKSRDFGSPRCRMRLYVIGVRCDLVGYAAFSSMICFLRNRLQKVHEYAGVLYLMWCVILRGSDMPNAWSQALLWRTHPLIKLVVTVTFVMNKVEGSWARPWLKKNIVCRVRNVMWKLTDMVCFQKLGILIDSDSIFRLIH